MQLFTTQIFLLSIDLQQLVLLASSYGVLGQLECGRTDAPAFVFGPGSIPSWDNYFYTLELNKTPLKLLIKWTGKRAGGSPPSHAFF